ncbi:FixH family protein [Sinorhizobium arboris]|uniref:FixH family protein n=1 Tax=Sinorhizobium arboris TaxID=76745 RepID=UPI000480E80D|nr:FixH family protein [Sinorhizobium arboris]
MTGIHIMPKAGGACLALMLLLTNAYAAATDYRFELVEREIAEGPEAIVAVRLIDERTREPVRGAIIFATRLDMAPEGMETMTAAVEAVPSTEPGVYRFKTNLGMEGGWRFRLAAKLQGEAETVQGELVLKAIP